jgi:hypothetical protein
MAPSLALVWFSLVYIGRQCARRQRRDGTVCGILNLRFDPEGAARYETERARKQELRQHEKVVLLEDYR